MFVDIKYLELIRFNECKECSECCKKPMTPLVLDDFEKVYEYFPILIAKLDIFKPVMLLSNEISCPYLKEDWCSIYENRPPACKIYPYSPWYDKILLDLSCKGIGTKGKIIPTDYNEFKNSTFFEKRFINITEKLQNTLKWLEKEELTDFGEYKNIKLYKLKPNDNHYNLLHQKSLQNLKNYSNISN